MARTHYVTKSQKPQPGCMSPRCTHETREIPVGSSYKHFTIRTHKGGRGSRKVYHSDCFIPQSHRTTSDKLGMIYDAQEGAEEALGKLDASQSDGDMLVSDLQAIAEEAASGIREAGEGYVESADNMESGFGTSTSISDELREKGESCESWADEIESVDIDEFDEDEAKSEAEDEVVAENIEVAREQWASEHTEDEDDEEEEPEDLEVVKEYMGEEGFQSAVDDAVEFRRSEWLAEQVSKVEDTLSNQPF